MQADNQSEIIYTVFVNGIPVLATIAANDMKLMSEAEVSKMLNKSIFTKAERMYHIFNFKLILFFHSYHTNIYFIYWYFSLFEGATSNAINTLIHNDHKSK